MIRLLPPLTFATLVATCAAQWPGTAGAEPPAGAMPDSPAVCSSYATGGDTHTTCAPAPSAPKGSAIACHDYSVGSDAHAECAPVAPPRLGGPRGLKALTVPPPASPLRCYTYRIGASTYTDCR